MDDTKLQLMIYTRFLEKQNNTDTNPSTKFNDQPLEILCN